jgi:hypothetical protein
VKALNHTKTLIKPMLIAAGLATAVAASVWASAPESMAPDIWRTFMTHHSAEAEGCFHASFPNTTWERVDCQEASLSVHPVHISRTGAAEVAGSGDYVAQTTKMMTLAGGSFAVSGVTSEVGVAEYTVDGVPQGILGPDQYAVQLNTNEWEPTSACHKQSGCHVWQQFIYANNYPTASSGGKVFMQYWLLDWGSSDCPSGWSKSGTANCYQDSKLISVPSLPITELGEEGLSGSAEANGNDGITFVYGNDSWYLSAKDSVLDIASVWNKAEFNVVGNGGGAQAQFNPGTTITVTLIVGDGTGTAPTCVKDGGTTGESNNLSVGPCTAADPFFPYITYTESY